MVRHHVFNTNGMFVQKFPRTGVSREVVLLVNKTSVKSVAGSLDLHDLLMYI